MTLNQTATLGTEPDIDPLIHRFFSQGDPTNYAIAKAAIMTDGQTARTIAKTAGLTNFSVASQTPAAATATVLLGSALAVPTGKLQIGTVFEWTFDVTKTAAGTATSTYVVQLGIAGTTADADILSFTKPAGTAAVDAGQITIRAVVRGPLTASCVMAGHFNLVHNLAATGHAQIPSVNVTTVSSTFDATTAGLIASLACTTGASDAVTTELLIARAYNI